MGRNDRLYGTGGKDCLSNNSVKFIIIVRDFSPLGISGLVELPDKQSCEHS